MTASHSAEVEALLVRLVEMRRLLVELAKQRSQLPEGPAAAEDFYRAEQALAQADKLLRRVRGSL